MKKILFVVNPKSGKGKIRSHLMDIIDIFNQNEMDVTVYITQKPMDACEVAKRRAEEFDMLICSGGDGTLDEVVTGMLKGGHHRPVGYIPAGSTNDFANSLKLPLQMKEAAKSIAKEHPYACDVGSFNGDYFVYIAAFGLFTDVAYETKQDMKNVLGHLAYLLEGAKRLFNIKNYHMKIRTHEEAIEGDFIYGMVTNSQSVGGFRNITGKQVCLNDGVFEVTLIRTPKNGMELEEILAALVSREMDNKRVYSFKADYVEFESQEEVPWTLDGENGGKHQKATVINHKQAFNIMITQEL
ncbi:MAG TPA: diacylglycerol kinase family lipid kinase [Candidatus Limivivens merdigallinarum]|uniref:Diacylglycerol kinase family lipid kinase n=1 Tax=Candidatus Limivivens merdigallinarum TaxID=2840859 RepID=A0A9D0ZW06_9FIRM|nr:diacylglycerol kinase family lipid kinase [Candidatus Limivivens merdigallinarum]